MSCTWAVDLFTVYTVTFKVLHVLVVFAYGRRRVVHVAITDHPTSDWTARQLIEATPFEDRPRFLVCDNDSLVHGAFARAAKKRDDDSDELQCLPHATRLPRCIREPARPPSRGRAVQVSIESSELRTGSRADVPAGRRVHRPRPEG